MSRRIITLGLMGALAGAVALGVLTRSGEAGPISLQNVRDLGAGHYAYLSGSNAGFFVTEEGILAVDAMISPKRARGLLDAIRDVSDKPIKFLVNTHWHRDHTFGNGAFPEETEILSTEACKKRLEKDGPDLWAEMAAEMPADFEGAELVIPEVTFTDEKTITLGDRTILVKFLGRGHTDGDAVIIDKEARVIYAGDLLFNGSHPLMMDGHPKDWVDTLQALEDIAQPDPERWKIVPGHGEPAPPALCAFLREYITTVRLEVLKALEAGTAVEKIAAAITLPDKFSRLRGRGLLERSNERIVEDLKYRK